MNSQINKQMVSSYLKETYGFESITPESTEVGRILTKIDIHDLPVNDESVIYVISEYGDEVLNPVRSVVFD